jgi:phage RecT family recombinase
MNAVSKPNPGREFGVQLIEMKSQLAQALPVGIGADRFVRVTLTAIQLNPELLECDRKSLLLACLRAANDGLMPDGREGAFVIFKDSKRKTKLAQWMPMYQGLLKKVRNTGDLMSISANVVYERDHFDYELGDNERIVHKPAIGERGKPIAAYAIARLRDGAVVREVMDANAIRQVQQVSRATAEGSPWDKWPDEMARKTVIRRLYKRLPSSTEMDKYLAATPLVERELAPQIADQLQHAQLPDPASYESSVFHHIADARLAISESDSAEEVDRIYFAAVKQLEQLEVEIPEELTQSRQNRLATLIPA